MECPICKRDWEDGCEQAVAIEKRGKCIACILTAGEPIQMKPYEFEPAKPLQEKSQDAGATEERETDWQEKTVSSEEDLWEGGAGVAEVSIKKMDELIKSLLQAAERRGADKMKNAIDDYVLCDYCHRGLEEGLKEAVSEDQTLTRIMEGGK